MAILQTADSGTGSLRMCVFVTCEDLWGGRVGDSSCVLGDWAHVWLWGAAGRRDSQGSHQARLQLKKIYIYISIIIIYRPFHKM